MHPFIDIFGKSVPAYGMMMALAGFAAWGLSFLLAKKGRVPDVTSVYLIGICGGLAGAFLLRPAMRVFEVCIFWDTYKDMPAKELLLFIGGEIVFYGGLIGGLIAIILFCGRFKIAIVPMLDILAPAAAFGHAVGRLGCFFAGCCYGIETDMGHPFSVIYPKVSQAAPPDIPLLAVPLIEAGFLFILTSFLTVLYLMRVSNKKNGICAALYLILYPIERFIIEFYRGDIIRGKYGPFTTSQYISALVFIAGIFFLAALFKYRKGNNCV